MDFKELHLKVNFIKRTRLDKIAYSSNFAYRNQDSELMKQVLRQIAINLGFLINRFDAISIEEVIRETRKNCIKSVYKELCKFHTNPEYLVNHIEKHKRQEAKSKLLYISNHIWFYLNYNNHQ